MRRHRFARSTAAIALIAAALPSGAGADVVVDTNARAAELASRLAPTPLAVRAMAITQVAVHDAVHAITGRGAKLVAQVPAAPGASLEAAVVAASRTALAQLFPGRAAEIEDEFRPAEEALRDTAGAAAGAAVGEQSARALVAACADDGAGATVAYRPSAAPGAYVPTTTPLVPHWGRRRPWLFARGDELRPGPPPELSSEIWRRDLEEIRSVGSRDSATRSAEQTAIARFWETTSPNVYWPLVRSVAGAPGRDTVDNARLFALAGMAMDDALIAVFDAKYAYGFWRPVTAIRAGIHGDGDPAWTPLIETPMHPEYPCAHCIVAAALGTVLEAEIGDGPTPVLASTSPTAGGAERRWASIEEFVREVSEARICDGVHYRNSTEVGREMGRRIGALAVSRLPAARR